MQNIIHHTQMISLIGQRLDRTTDPWGQYALLKQLEDELSLIESHLVDTLYPMEETLDGQLNSPMVPF